MLGVYNYTVVLTYIGMLSGFSGIVFTMQGSTHQALICLIVSGVCDMFDGKVASTMERTSKEKRFGVQIDSLSDLICFGLLPALIVVAYCKKSNLSYYAGSIYVLSALIRLAWFNVDEEERQDIEEGVRQYYLGLPVTLAAAFIPTTVWLGEKLGASGIKLYPTVLTLMSIAFLTPFKLKKPSLPKVGMVICGGVGLLLMIMSGMDV